MIVCDDVWLAHPAGHLADSWSTGLTPHHVSDSCCEIPNSCAIRPVNPGLAIGSELAFYEKVVKVKADVAAILDY